MRCYLRSGEVPVILTEVLFLPMSEMAVTVFVFISYLYDTSIQESPGTRHRTERKTARGKTTNKREGEVVASTPSAGIEEVEETQWSPRPLVTTLPLMGSLNDNDFLI